ncbi:hypothetical protein DHEL01_v210504 [Diaporthe helianthi]|uniref:Uncharacterized protein n=1 Tax=Diaporthe helianthi TaxID=158607 RepID=A0A2P5HLH7_DIAHE|nr:hypothetical protein DHEL01_v210504 [Diaporthe helianthi]
MEQNDGSADGWQSPDDIPPPPLPQATETVPAEVASPQQDLLPSNPTGPARPSITAEVLREAQAIVDRAQRARGTNRTASHTKISPSIKAELDAQATLITDDEGTMVKDEFEDDGSVGESFSFPELEDAARGIHKTHALANLLTMTPKRTANLRYNRRKGYINITRAVNVEAIAIQMTGNLHMGKNACDSCKKGHGPFEECVSLGSNFASRACGGCHFSSEGTRCSMHKTQSATLTKAPTKDKQSRKRHVQEDQSEEDEPPIWKPAKKGKKSYGGPATEQPSTRDGESCTPM